MLAVDTTWGELQPLQITPEVRTVGELELIDLVEQGAALVDSRTIGSLGAKTLPGAVRVPHAELPERADELDRSRLSILFCNGPQCPQSPDSVRSLLDAGYPADRLAYYRGGLHDWTTLGFPTEQVDG